MLVRSRASERASNPEATIPLTVPMVIDPAVQYPPPDTLIPNMVTTNTLCDDTDASLKEYETHYLYIVDSTTQQYVKHTSPSKHHIYTVTYNSGDEKTIDQIGKMIQDSCNKRNITIYVLLPNENGVNPFTIAFSHYLHVQLEDKYYSNVTIISFFSLSTVKPPYFMHNYLKILIPNVVDSQTNYKKFFKVLNVHCHPTKIKGELTRIWDFSEKSPLYQNKVVRYQFMKIKDLYDYDSVRSLLVERRCSTGKLVQFTGTCWINAIMNSVLLPKNARKIMVDQCKKYIRNAKNEDDRKKYTTPLFDIYDARGKLSIAHIVTTIIYHLFVKKSRLMIDYSDRDNPKYNFMLVLADKFKRLHYDSHISSLQFKDISFYESKDIRFGNGGNDKVKFTTLEYLIKEYLIDNLWKFTHINFQHRYIREIDPTPSMTVSQGVREYKLVSAVLKSSTQRHVICGFICEDTEYMYDGNMYQAIQTNWTKNNYEGYMQHLKDIRKYAEYKKENLNNTKEAYRTHILIYVAEEEGEQERGEERDEREIQAIQENVPRVPCLR
jgi:hypothetical protein